MALFNFCCPTKSKKTIDYISTWIDETDIELKQIHSDISRLNSIVDNLDNEMKDLLTEELGPIFDEYAKTYDYSSVIPELDTLQSEIDALNEALSEYTPDKIRTRLASITVEREGDLGDENGVISFVISNDGGEDWEEELTPSNMPNFHKALSGGYANKTHSHKEITAPLAFIDLSNTEDEDENEKGEIDICISHASDEARETSITYANIPNLHRALADPSTETPEGGTAGNKKLITSKAVYDALALKVDKLNYSDTNASFANSDVIDTIYETGVYILTYTPTTDNPATPHMLQVRHYLDQPAPNSAYVNMVEQCLIDKDGIRIRTCVCDVDGVPSGTWSSWG